MISKDHPIGPQEAQLHSHRTPQGASVAHAASPSAAHNLKGLSSSDPLYAPGASYDPYNTGAFRVLAERPRRRTLDDMRELDAEIRRTRKPWL